MKRAPLRQQGTAIAEALVALLALAPFLIGIPLLGKQLDVKHKSIDAARYAVWERTVWSSHGPNRKDDADIALEAQDRTLGDSRAAIVAADAVRRDGVTENRFWRDAANQRLIEYRDPRAIAIDQRRAREPIEVGSLFVPAFAYGGGIMSAAGAAMQVRELGMDARTFTTAQARIVLRPILQSRATRQVSLRREDARESDEAVLVQQAGGAVLSDSWSARDETELGRRVEALTIDELVRGVEIPSRVLALNALGKGEPLFGEGQYAWDADLRPSSRVLPRAYVERDR